MRSLYSRPSELLGWPPFQVPRWDSPWHLPLVDSIMEPAHFWPDLLCFLFQVVASGPERGLPGAVQDMVSPAWRQVQWLLNDDGQSAESARTRFFAAVMGSAVLMALLLRFAVSLADSNSLNQPVSRRVADNVLRTHP